MVREAKLLGMTRNLGAKIDTALKTTFGFDVSGRYLLVLGRESADDSSTAVRLQLFKRSQKGLSFGLNLSVGVTGQNDLPTDIDELVKAVFGVHGLQAMKDLHLIEQWTDPATDLGQTAARLLNDTGLKLLTEATGIDAAKEFTKARQIVLDEFKKWDALPEKVSAATWSILSKLGDGADKFKAFLTALADNDPKSRAAAFASALQEATLATQPQVNGLPPWRTRACLRFPASSTKCSPLPRKRSTFSTEESSGDSRVSLMTNSILPKSGTWSPRTTSIKWTDGSSSGSAISLTRTSTSRT